MTDDLNHALLARLLAGECSAAEAAAVQAWLEASPDRAKAFQEFEQLWRTAPSAAVTWNVDGAWSKVHGALQERAPLTLVPAEPAAPKPAGRRRRFALTRSRWWMAAAAAMLVVGASVVALTQLGPRPGNRVDRLPMREIVTAKGQQTLIRLDDGTRVSLGVNSRLYFPPMFGVTSRDVYLEGEALFEVTHDPSKPFVVHAARSVTQVLGTQFAVRAYPGERDVRVVVVEGEVRVRPEHLPADSGAVLTRRQLGQLGADGHIRVQREVAVELYTDWIDGRISFRDTPLRDVLRELEHWYDVELVLADAGLDSLRLTAVFHHEPLEVVARTIAHTLDLAYEQTGAAVVFSRHRRTGR